VTDLPADQRAVVELVLARGRDYNEIARLLSIDRAGVRERALAALDALGPATEVAPERRALITDYLLGQLPAKVSEDVHARLERSDADAAWARGVAAQLGPIAAAELPAVPSGDAAQPSAAEPASEEPVGEGGAKPPASRTGGAILIGLGVLAVAAVIVIVIAAVSSGGSSSSSHTTSSAARSSSTAPTPTALARVKLTATAKGSKAQGAAEVFAQSNARYLALVAQNLTANVTTAANHNYYAVWLYNSASDTRLLGFAQPVTANGVLRTLGGPLQSGDSHFKQLLLTLETQAHPRTPGSVILSGPISLP
jgi:hypothetical protein